jgi:hypothetical protein
MPTIGRDNLAAAGTTYLESVRTTADAHFIVNNAVTFTPVNAQEVFEVGFIAGITSNASVEIGVYRTDTLARIATGTCTSPGVGAATRLAQAITPVALTIGVTYCVAWRIVSDGALFINAGGEVGNGDRSATLTGANALPATFNPDGATLDTGFSVFATTQVASGGSVAHIPAYLSMLRSNQ